MTIRLTIESDTATPALAQVAQLVDDKAGLLGAAGQRLARDTSAHVAAWGQSHPNQLGGRRTNYWAGIAAKITPADTLEVSGDTATVTLGGPEMPGLARAFGDVTIVPGTNTPGVKYLAIPARSEAGGMRPADFGGKLMIFWKGKGQPGGLAQATPATRTRFSKRGAKGSTYSRPGLVFYWFANSVTQPQDRSLLPSDDELSESANAGAKDWVDQQIKKI
jgi:hypothetical protein